MEILNNIWNAISTPNELLINIISIPLYFVEAFVDMNLFISILKINSTKKEKIIYVLLVSIIGIISMNFIPNPFNVYLNYLFALFIGYIIFKHNNPTLKLLLSMVLAFAIYNLLGGLLLNPYLTILKIDTQDLSNIVIYRIPYMLLIYALIYLIIWFFKYKIFKIFFLENIDLKSKRIIILTLLLGVITLIIQSLILFYYVDILPLFITFLSFISLLAYFALSVYCITRVFKLFLTNQKLETVEEYNKKLSSLNDSIRSFKHDFDNTLTTIGGFIRTNDMEGLKKYYFELEDDSQRVNNLYILNPEVVNNNGIYNLITQKYSKAEEKDIKVNITFLLDLSTLNMKIYEFARILGILLDNAIEASAESDEKIINITFRNDIKNSAQIVTIENSYKDKNVNTEEIFQKGITGKEDHQGLGLWKVKKIVDKNSNVYLFTNKNDKFFSQQLEIY